MPVLSADNISEQDRETDQDIGTKYPLPKVGEPNLRHTHFPFSAIWHADLSQGARNDLMAKAYACMSLTAISSHCAMERTNNLQFWLSSRDVCDPFYEIAYPWYILIRGCRFNERHDKCRCKQGMIVRT